MEYALKKFFDKLYQLKKQEKDHIWLYLLNNLVGIRLLLLKKKMDLIITNPPWLTYKDSDPKLQENMKVISEQFNIKPDAKNITNIEEAIIFLYKIPDLYLRKDGKGKIAFVMPRSLLVSSQSEEARRFDYFEHIEVFEFDDLVFNIECCCIFGNYTPSDITLESVFHKYPIKCQYLHHETMELLESYELSPYVYFQKKKNESFSVKKLIKPEIREDILPVFLSAYVNDFIQGADLIPKALLYCDVQTTTHEGKISIINPWISPKAKKPWNRKFYQQKRIESENLFRATLSRQLYPFYIKPYYIFLPLDKELQYNPEKIGPFSRKHWNTIKDTYYNILKKDLFEVGINYRNKLCTNNRVRESQRVPLKVIFPNAKKLMAAVVNDPKGRTFIDSTLYYCSMENQTEAYYICGMLNVPELYKTVKIVSDTRHHHKRPLYFNIPRYTNIKEQNLIAKLSQECETIVEDYVINSKKVKESDLYRLIQENLREIERIGLEILRAEEGLEIVKEYEFENE